MLETGKVRARYLARTLFGWCEEKTVVGRVCEGRKLLEDDLCPKMRALNNHRR